MLMSQQKVQMRANVPSNVKFCFPSMAGQINCMHSKLQMLSHPTHLRIVVPSANLVPYDWGEEGGVIENVSLISVRLGSIPLNGVCLRIIIVRMLGQCTLEANIDPR
jgi:hypothetical protein